MNERTDSNNLHRYFNICPRHDDDWLPVYAKKPYYADRNPASQARQAGPAGSSCNRQTSHNSRKNKHFAHEEHIQNSDSNRKKLSSIHKPMDVQPETVQDVPDTLSGYDCEVADWANHQDLVEDSPVAVSPPQEIETADGLNNQGNADFVVEELESADQTAVFSGAILFSSALAVEGNAPPVYPRIARRLCWEGKIWLIAEVNKNGFVQAVQLEQSSGHGFLDQAAFEAVSSWKFKPHYLGARRIECEIRIPI